MNDGLSQAARARVQVGCGRIVGAARNIAEAHGFGVAEGPHEKPWSAEYHHEAVLVYAITLPWSYQRDIARLFNSCVYAMAKCSIPPGLAEDWFIVTAYFRECSGAIIKWLPYGKSQSSVEEPAERVAIVGEAPGLIRYERLAELTTREGALRLEQAAVAVQELFCEPATTEIGDDQLRLLRMVASGATIAEIAHEFSYAQRTVFRALARLWKALGVTGRIEGIRVAAEEGLLDDSRT